MAPSESARTRMCKRERTHVLQYGVRTGITRLYNDTLTRVPWYVHVYVRTCALPLVHVYVLQYMAQVGG